MIQKTIKHHRVSQFAVLLSILLLAATAVAAVCTQSPQCPMCLPHQAAPDHGHGSDAAHGGHFPSDNRACCADGADSVCIVQSLPLLGLADNGAQNLTGLGSPTNGYMTVACIQIDEPTPYGWLDDGAPPLAPIPPAAPLFLANQTFLC